MALDRIRPGFWSLVGSPFFALIAFMDSRLQSSSSAHPYLKLLPYMSMILTLALTSFLPLNVRAFEAADTGSPQPNCHGVEAEVAGLGLWEIKQKSKPKVTKAEPFNSSMNRSDRHMLALRAASLAYALPSLESSSFSLSFVERFRDFTSAVPEGYRIKHVASNAISGLKFLILQPLKPARPWIFAAAGTETKADWYSNFTLGMAQYQGIDSLQRTASWFSSCKSPFAEDSEYFAEHDWIVTGHSLGCGLIQRLATTIATDRAYLGLKPLRLEVVTFNTFGLQHVLEGVIPEGHQSAIAYMIRFFNYFIKGDPVSRIGSHFGETLQLAPPVGIDVSDPLKAHSLATILQIVEKTSQLKGKPYFSEAQSMKPPPYKALSYLSKGSFFLEMFHPPEPKNDAQGDEWRRNAVILIEKLFLHFSDPKSGSRLGLAYVAELAASFRNDWVCKLNVDELDPQRTAHLVRRLEDVVEKLRAKGISPIDGFWANLKAAAQKY